MVWTKPLHPKVLLFLMEATDVIDVGRPGISSKTALRERMARAVRLGKLAVFQEHFWRQSRKLMLPRQVVPL
jgi:hypothetical protein